MKNFLQYKGYTGSVDFSEEDNCLFGKVIGIRALLSYEGESVADLKKDFQNCIDEYLELCADKSIDPEKPYKGSFNVRVTPEIHRDAALCAAELGMTLNGFVTDALAKAITTFSTTQTN